MKISIPIIATTIEQAKMDYVRLSACADIVELRLDNIAGITAEGLADILSVKGKTPICVTNRSEEEGGKFIGPESVRVGLLETAMDLGVEYIDIELASGPNVIKRFVEKKNDTQSLIISYHNFTQTPHFSVLEKVFKRQMDAGATIGKIATFATTPQDNIQIFKLIEVAVGLQQPIIAICMGKLGQISRVAAPYLGSYWTFACEAEGKESAPGQVDHKTMRKLDELFA